MGYFAKIMDENKKIRDLYEKLLSAPIYSFPNKNSMGSFKPSVTEKHAVYIIYNPKDIVVHVGRSIRGRKGLVQRLNNHLYGNSSFTIECLSGKGKQGSTKGEQYNVSNTL